MSRPKTAWLLGAAGLAVVGFMMWAWVSVMVVLFGAELNCEAQFEAGIRRRRLPKRD